MVLLLRLIDNMKKIRFIVMFLLIALSSLYAIVGDWKSYGSQLTPKDLYVQGKFIKAVSHGGPILFDTEMGTFLKSDMKDKLAHIDIRSYYINSDGSEWYSFASGVSGINYFNQNSSGDYFDLNFKQAGPFTGIDGHVFVVYKPEFTPQIAHFVKYQQNYIYHDSYNQFPGDPSEINDIQILGDTLYLASDKGLMKAWINNANLKPKTAWEIVSMDTGGVAVHLGNKDDILFWSDDQNTIYKRSQGLIEKVMKYNGESSDFFVEENSMYFASKNKIYNLDTKNEIYQARTSISGLVFQGDTLWVAEENLGLRCISNEHVQNFIPNTMMNLTANALAIDEDRKVYISGLEGVAMLQGETWHNLVYSPYEEAIHDHIKDDSFSADTLNIAYHGASGERMIYDALISSSGKLYSTVTHTSISPLSGQSPGAKGPGVLYEIDLNDYSSYEVYDTTNNVFESTRGVGGGSDFYLIMGGLAEDQLNNIYILNRHTLKAETLVRLDENGNVKRFTQEESNNTLQVLAREIAVDKNGYLWIANQARQEDVPRTKGGITVYNPRNGQWAFVDASDGLVSNDVYSLDVDPLTGNIWVATAQGVQMIYAPSTISSATEFTMNAKISGLSNMVPVKIRIDPKGNKWILTQSQGVQIYMSNNRFYNDGAGLSTENSGLLDNVVFDVVFDTQKGYAYFLSASGLSRFEIAWTKERESMNNVIVFPQPFKPGRDAYIAFDGLAEQSHVRITSIDGRVVHSFDTDAVENLEKQVVWNGKLPNGDYIRRGVYLAFITNINGLKASVKFAVE